MSAPPVPDPAPVPGEREALRFWLKLGMISFGGPAGQIAIMHDELVERRRWIPERRFLHALNFCMALPGPEAQQLASYVGYSMHGWRGALAAGGLFVLPSFVLLVVLSGVYALYGDVVVIEGVVRGLAAAVIALILTALIRIGGRVLRTPAAVALAAASFVAFVAGVPFPVIIAVAALLGWAAARRPGLLAPAAGHAEAEQGDHAGLRAALPSGRRALVTLAVTLVVWLVPVALMLAAGGLTRDLAWLFTVAALVTFGGAYAVLPYVTDQAVERYGWVSTDDVVAGLALGESTPGPLIMVNTFIGFMAGYNVAGGLAWGLAGAAIATFCTFAPSFVIIINGAPVIDRLSLGGGVAQALGGVTVSVVGAIAALGVFIARESVLHDDAVDWLVLALAPLAFVALWRLRAGVVWVVALCGLAGLAAALVTLAT